MKYADVTVNGVLVLRYEYDDDLTPEQVEVVVRRTAEELGRAPNMYAAITDAKHATVLIGGRG